MEKCGSFFRIYAGNVPQEQLQPKSVLARDLGVWPFGTVCMRGAGVRHPYTRLARREHLAMHAGAHSHPSDAPAAMFSLSRHVYIHEN